MDKLGTEAEPKIFTLGSFLNNPTGDAGSASHGRKLVFEDLESRFRLLRLAKKEFKHATYKVGTDIFIKVEIPSESIDDFSYDVIIKFRDVEPNSTSLAANTISVFSNAPSFVYSYAYTFNMFKMLVDELASKIDKKALTELPKIRNPDAVTFYEKTITMAMMYIRDNDLMKTNVYRSSLVTIPKSKFKDVVKSSEEKQDMYNVLKKAESKKKAAEKAAKKAFGKLPAAERQKKNIENGIIDRVAPMKVDKKVNKKLDTKVPKTKVSKVNNKVSNKVDMKIK
jgi:hypothetical protein